MASVRQTRTGKFELTVRHPQLPKGRKFFTFDTQEEADRYGEQWDLLVKAGLPPPAELLEPVKDTSTLGSVLRAWANSGNAAPTEQPILALLMTEVGGVKLTAVTYPWCETWVQRLKVKQNLAPSSVRKRVGALSRAIDAWLRGHPGALAGNPLRLLPDGYSSYSERDQKLVLAADGKVKEDAPRDRRLKPGEEAKILAVLEGQKRPDKERAVGDPDLRMLFLFILHTGVRLKEAYTVRLADVGERSVKVQTSKQRRGKVKWRVVPIVPELHGELQRYAAANADAAGEPSATDAAPRQLLFPFWDGVEPVENVTNRLSKRFTTVFTYAGIDDLTEHDIRHEATCRWYERRNANGHWVFHEREIVKIMGWSANSKMPAVYASFRGEDLADRLWTSSQ